MTYIEKKGMFFFLFFFLFFGRGGGGGGDNEVIVFCFKIGNISFLLLSYFSFMYSHSLFTIFLKFINDTFFTFVKDGTQGQVADVLGCESFV